MLGHLIRIDSKTTGGSDYPLLLASADDPRLCHLDGEQWESNIARLPTLRYDFFGGNFGGQITSPPGQFSVSIDGLDMDRAFASAQVRFYEGEIGDGFHNFRLVFDGYVAGEPETREGIAAFTITVDPAWLDTLLLQPYAGTGDEEGTEDITGQLKPLVFGHVRFADARLLDPVALIYQVNDGPVTFTAAYDRAAAFGPANADYASYALLDAATVPAGGWATCEALGLARFGAPPDGRVAFDVETDARLPGEIITAIAARAGATVDVATLDTARPYNLQLQILEQTTPRALIQQIADSVAAVAGISWTGDLYAQPVEIDPAPAETLATDGSSDIAVGEVSQLAIAAPYWRLATQAEPTFVVYSLGEVASDLTWRGTYEAAREYRLDDAVFASDGRAFAYINATPDSGNAPPTAPSTSNGYWSLIGAATVGAPAGTTVAGRDAEDVADTIAAGGGVADDQVSTGAIVAEAVTTKTYAFTAGSVNISAGSYTYQEVQSATITTTGEDVEVDGYFELQVIDNCKYEYRFLRDGSSIIDLGPITVNTNDGPPAFFRFVDSPVAGTYEYTVEVACNDATDINVLNRGLSLKEIKR